MNLKFLIAGRYKIKIRRADGSVRKELDWFDNLITNTGMDWHGAATSDYLQAAGGYIITGRCAVGTNSTPPAYTDTTLGTQIAAQPPFGSYADQWSGTASYVSGPPAYLTTSHIFSFALGAVIGNLTEVGVGILPAGSTSSSSVLLYSHALIQSGGSPTTLPVTSADQLEVTFELRYYVNTTDSPYSITISGNSYSGNIRSSVHGTYILNNQIDTTNSSNNSTLCTVYNGSLGPITGVPTGSALSIGSAPLPAYTAGTYTKSYTYSANTSSGNLSGGISVILIDYLFQSWQFSISPSLAKDNTKTLSLTFSISWARYP